jgi:hypothetical protein
MRIVHVSGMTMRLAGKRLGDCTKWRGWEKGAVGRSVRWATSTWVG